MLASLALSLIDVCVTLFLLLSAVVHRDHYLGTAIETPAYRTMYRFETPESVETWSVVTDDVAGGKGCGVHRTAEACQL